MRKNLFLATCLFSLLAIACQKTPETIDVESITLNQTSLSLTVGDSFELKAKVLPKEAEAQYPVIWTSKASEIVSVTSSGVLTAMAPGETTVTAYSHNKEATCTVIVAKKTIPVSSVSLNKEMVELKEGETIQLIATILPEDATDKTVEWISSDTEIATVDGEGLVSACKEGVVTITASVGELESNCSVTVKENFTGMAMMTYSGGTVVIHNSANLTIEYNIADSDWKATSDSEIRISVPAGKRVWFRGDNASYLDKTRFDCEGSFDLYGNLMSLISSHNYKSLDSITEKGAFRRLFADNTNLHSDPYKEIELPATIISEECYAFMFSGCTNLHHSPELPAMIVPDYAYTSMFEGCSNLFSAGNILAQEVGEHACEQMFMYCRWLEDAPTLPATKLGIECYSHMFFGCQNLTTAPDLPATTLASGCYIDMFNGCNLTEAPELPATNLASGCYLNMFMGCKNITKAPILPAQELAVGCYSGMFARCDALTDAPELPALEMAVDCYNSMFSHCINLKTPPALPSKTLAPGCYCGMFAASGITVAPELPAETLTSRCYQEMFWRCENLEKAPELPALTLALSCYSLMFKGCIKLNYINARFLTTPGDSYTKNWVQDVAPNGVFIKNPDAVWDVVGVNGIPEGWTVQQ